MHRNSTKDRLKQKLKSKSIVSRDLTWQLVEIACRELKTNLLKNSTIKLNQELGRELLAKLQKNDDPEPIFDSLNQQVSKIAQLCEFDINTPTLPFEVLTALHRYFFNAINLAFTHILNQLRISKPKNAALKIETDMFAILLSLVNLQARLINYRTRNNDFNFLINNIDHVKILYELNLFLSNHCLLITSDAANFQKILAIQQNPGIIVAGPILRDLINIFFQTGQLDEVEKYLIYFKSEIAKIKSESDPLYYQSITELYLDMKWQLAIQKQDFSTARHYFSKVRRQATKDYDFGIPFSDDLILMTKFSSGKLCNNNPEEALFFATVSKDCIQKNIELFENPKKLHPEYQGQESDQKERISAFEANLIAINIVIHKLKKDITNSKYKALELLNIGFFDSIKLAEKEGNKEKYVIVVKCEPDQVASFYNICLAKKIFCYQDNDSVVFEKPHHLSVDVFKKTIDLWLEIKDQNSISKNISHINFSTNSTSTTASVVATTTTLVDVKSVDNKQQTLSVVEPTHSHNRKDKKKNKKSANNKNSVGSTVPHDNKMKQEIKWDNQHIYRFADPNCSIYQLYAPYSVDQNYVCIHPELIDIIYHTNKAAFWDLHNLCTRGYVLGNSKGKKGFIIHSQVFTQQGNTTTATNFENKNKKSNYNTNAPKNDQMLSIKGKNCCHDWRFFGRSFKKVTISNKTHTLFLIDSWSPKHKKKATRPIAEITLKKEC
ncbi:MAG: hypothetical protein KIT56_00950 [Gammaproteobacteria bacterium]|nr:hypothetical protein [Gammaproteobacteria bacterium]MCW5582452.1 hypothetical protein [Gammaproteobacteria bacterium]